MDIPAAANVLGTIGAVCWSIQLIPQIILNYRRHHAIGLQPSMMMLWAWAGVPLGVYNIVEEFNIALRVQPQILTLLSLVTWIQCYHYQRDWHISRSLITVTPIACLMGGIQGALIVALRIARDRHLQWPLTLMAVLSAVLLAAGVLRHYWDIYVHRTVRGLSFLFVGIDAAGDLSSLLSLLFQPTLDMLGIVIYATELVLWIGVFVCAAFLNFLPRVRGKVPADDEHKRKRQSEQSPQCANEPEGMTEMVTMHDLPSSSSVCRTASNELEDSNSDSENKRAVT